MVQLVLAAYIDRQSARNREEERDNFNSGDRRERVAAKNNLAPKTRIRQDQEPQITKNEKWCALGDNFRTWMRHTVPYDWVQLQA